MRFLTTIATSLALAGCASLFEEPIERNCEVRSAFYPDEDGDGVGDPDGIYIGCDQPTGWVSVPPKPPDSDPSSDPDPSTSDTDPSTSDTDA